MKHKVISVDDPESFKESILDMVEWTEFTMAAAFRRELDLCGVNEDAGVRLKLMIHTMSTSQIVAAWMDLPVTSMAESVYVPRLNVAASRLTRLFHVEQSQRKGDRDEITVHRIIITHEYARPV